MTDLATAIQFIRDTLRAQPVLAGIPVEPVTEENIKNGVSIRYVTGTDQETNGADRVIVSEVFQVVLSSASDSLTATIVAQGKAIDALQGAHGTTPDGIVYIVRRMQPVYFSKRESDGQTWQYLGGQYEVLVRGN